jgi:murein L,D-transpeptidase YcbB/YkuD
VWVAADGLNRQGAAVVAELARSDEWGLDASAFRLPPVLAPGREWSSRERAEAETLISAAILKYARYARGGRAEPSSLSPNLDRTLPTLPPLRVIGEIAEAADPAGYLRQLHPRHPQFEALRQQYLALRRAEADAASGASGPRADNKAAVGNGPSAPSARKLLLNMEEWRWMPDNLGDFYVWVNVPEFTLRVVKMGKVIHSERVIVGKTDKQTPIFSRDLLQVIFHPYWGVPDSITKNDILPSLARGSTRLLERYNLRVQRFGRDIEPSSVDWTSVDMRSIHVYQPPGAANVLGFVKFRFPNKHDVYMHDTPDKQLFNAPVRAFSHGCMRVRDPQKLAELLLAEDQGWPASRVAAAIHGGPPNNPVDLKGPIPVHITYFTATVEEDGKLRTFADIYGHESRIAMGIEGKAHLIPKTAQDAGRAEAIGRLTESIRAAAKQNWVNRAFANH